jgi:transposase
MTIEDVSKNLKVSWGTIKQIDKTHLEKHYSKPYLKNIRYLGIDEFAVQKGHKYKTVVMDMETHRVVYVGEGRAEASLQFFCKRLKSSGARIKAIAMDMWPAYISWVVNNFPHARIVFDRFHIVKKLNEALSDIRKELYQLETDLNKRSLLKGTRWLLLKNSGNLLAKRDEPEKLKEALKVNLPLATAYYLKEELRLLWSQKSVTAAKKFLGSWIARAKSVGLSSLNKFTNTLLAHRSGIFSWFEDPISNGPLEGMNNKIKVLKRKAYGYRDMDYFNLKILSLHTNRYALL